MEKAKHVANLVSSSIVECPLEGIKWSDIYESAIQRGLLKQLHAIFLPIAPPSSKIKTVYHHANLKSAMKEAENTPAEGAICQNYLNYRVNFGKKFVLIDQIEDDAHFEVLKNFNDTDIQDWLIEPNNLIDQDILESHTTPAKIVHISRSNNGTIQILLEEQENIIYYGEPKLDFLSETGKDFRHIMKMQRQLLVTGFHKFIIDPTNKVRIVLIDTATLKNPETPTDKAKCLLNYLNSRMKISIGNVKPVTFFSAIQKLYDDPTVGSVIGGYFYTQTGSRFINFSKGTGTDLRTDPFQKGGEAANYGKPSFVKLQIEWPKFKGMPFVNLQGSSEMFETPDKSLLWFETIFGTNQGAQANHLERVLAYAVW